MHERARVAIYGAVSALLGIAWYPLVAPLRAELVPPAAHVLLALFVATSMSIAWFIRTPLTRSRVPAAIVLGAVVPYVAAAAVGLALGFVIWISDPSAHTRALAEFPLLTTQFAFERMLVVVPLGIASVLVLRTVLVVGRHTDDSPAQAH